MRVAAERARGAVHDRPTADGLETIDLGHHQVDVVKNEVVDECVGIALQDREVRVRHGLPARCATPLIGGLAKLVAQVDEQMLVCEGRTQ